MNKIIMLFSCATFAMASCASQPGIRVSDGSAWHSYVQHTDGGAPGGDLASVRFRPDVCEGQAIKPARQILAEGDLIEFLKQQKFDVQVERPRADLSYVVVSGAGTAAPVRLRVATLPSADEAGRELHQALLEHGPGAWGVHRSNLAVLGIPSDYPDALTFAAKTKLACWGVFTVAGRDDAFVIPGAYIEI